MVDAQTLREMALALPGAEADDAGFSVGGKGFAWYWNERVPGVKARVPNRRVLAVRTANGDEKAALIAADPDVCFTEDHYNGFPAVLVRLDKIERAVLAELLADAWRTKAGRRAVRAFDQGIAG